MAVWSECLVFYFAYLFYLVQLSSSQLPDYYDYPTANLSTTWTNNPTSPNLVNFTDGSRVILVSGKYNFLCGFFCNGTCDNSYLFSVLVVAVTTISGMFSSYDRPQVVWSANRNQPVGINATLQLTSDGDLVLKDFDGTTAWSTNTGGKSVIGLNLSDAGNLFLFNNRSETVWQSFDHPSDSLVLGQKLTAGKKLRSVVYATKNTTQISSFSLTVTDDGMFASIESAPPQIYQQFLFNGTKTNREATYVVLQNQRFSLFVNSSLPNEPDISISLPDATIFNETRFVRLCPDGHLRLYELIAEPSNSVLERFVWKETADFLTQNKCSYPTVCGNYGICSEAKCACPTISSTGSSSYFRPVNDWQPDLGCSVTTPLSCESLLHHKFVELKDTAYSSLHKDLENVDLESCKLNCLKNCSCKAAIFQYGSSDDANGSCYLPNQIFSLIKNQQAITRYNSTVFLKVQNVSTVPVPPRKKKIKQTVIILSSVFGLILFIGVFVLFVWKKSKADDSEEEVSLDQMPGLPTRFSYEELKAFTEDFSNLLGKGAFGSVFEGTLADGTKVAVKRLDRTEKVIMTAFLDELKIIGGIHHVNLVRLLGFCVTKLNMIIVCEFMSKGSLDKWIFHKTPETALDWPQRKKVVLDIAKGLAYLHEDCAQKILHLDIKPQNILLDDNLNAKIGDFGLSKLIDREQSKVVMTGVLGTPGYIAPELWSGTTITEKADVYSFGKVVLEILYGSRNNGCSQSHELMHVISIFEMKAEEDKLLDLVQNCHESDFQFYEAEMMKMMKLAAWCVQKDYKRPSMSMVVKVLEGVREVEHNIDLLNLRYPSPSVPNISAQGTRSESSPSVESGES